MSVCFPDNLSAFFFFLFRCGKPQITWFFLSFSLYFFSFFKDYNKKLQISPSVLFSYLFFFSSQVGLLLRMLTWFCLSLKITPKNVRELTFLSFLSILYTDTQMITPCSVGWGCRIHRLLLCRGIKKNHKHIHIN